MIFFSPCPAGAGEREALFQELNRRCDEVAKLNAEHIRLEMAAELQKVDATSSEMLLKQKALGAVDQVCEFLLDDYWIPLLPSPVSGHVGGGEASLRTPGLLRRLGGQGCPGRARRLRGGPALEAEQRLIVERLTEQLTKEAAQRHELMKRLGVVEMDVQKAGDGDGYGDGKKMGHGW